MPASAVCRWSIPRTSCARCHSKGCISAPPPLRTLSSSCSGKPRREPRLLAWQKRRTRPGRSSSPSHDGGKQGLLRGREVIQQRTRNPSVPVRLFIHASIIDIILILSPRNLLPALALVSLRSQTRSSWLPCRFPLCLLTQHSEAFGSSCSLIMLQQIDHVASTGLVHVENQGKGHVGHRWGSPAGYWSSVTISLTRRQSSVP